MMSPHLWSDEIDGKNSVFVFFFFYAPRSSVSIQFYNNNLVYAFFLSGRNGYTIVTYFEGHLFYFRVLSDPGFQLCLLQWVCLVTLNQVIRCHFQIWYTDKRLVSAVCMSSCQNIIVLPLFARYYNIASFL